MDDNLIVNEALSILALNELCEYIDLKGNPVLYEYDMYAKMHPLDRYTLSEKQFELVKKYIEDNEALKKYINDKYKGTL